MVLVLKDLDAALVKYLKINVISSIHSSCSNGSKDSRETAGMELLEWNSENKEAWISFSESLVSKLSTCFEKKEIVLHRIGKQRELMWSRFHQLRTQRQSEQSITNLWTTLLKNADCEVDPIFYQFVTDSVMELLINIRYPVAPSSTSAEVSLDHPEENAIRYIVGYSIRSLRKKIGRMNLKEKDELEKCLEEMIEEAKSTHHSADWTKAIDRGGLIHVDDMTYAFFADMELVTRQYINSRPARDVNMLSVVDLIMQDENVLFSWSITSASWDPEIAKVLLKLIAEHYVNMRGFSFAKSVMELYKKKAKQNVQKSKGLRKQLQTPATKN